MIDDDSPSRPSAAAASAYLAALAMTESHALFDGDDEQSRRRRAKPRHARSSQRRWALLEFGR